MCCGSKVGVQAGTTQHIIVQGLEEKATGVMPAVYDRFILSVMDLLEGRIDSIVLDTPFGEQYLKTYPDHLISDNYSSRSTTIRFPVCRS